MLLDIEANRKFTPPVAILEIYIFNPSCCSDFHRMYNLCPRVMDCGKIIEFANPQITAAL